MMQNPNPKAISFPEPRYIVVKVRDLQEARALDSIDQNQVNVFNSIMDTVSRHRIMHGKRLLNCLVIEDDWPEYLQVYEALLTRVIGENTLVPDTVIRLQVELKQLQTRRDALLLYISGNNQYYLACSEQEKSLLQQQYDAMGAYETILAQRISVALNK